MTQREEWLEWRRAGIGGSDIAGIVGLSPWRTPYAIWAEKCVEGIELQEQTDSMEFGLRVEPVLVQWFQDRTGLVALGEQTWCANPERPWMRATADFFVAETEDAALADCIGIGEMKTTGDSAAKWAEELPDYYRCQGQWLMAVTGMSHVWLPTLHLAFGRREFVIHELERDEGDIAFLTKAGEAFWSHHVVTGEPPATDASEATTRALKAAWSGEKGRQADVSGLVEQIEQWQALKSVVKDAEFELAAVENEIRGALRDATEGVVDGQVVVSWRPQASRRLDAERLRAEQPEIAEEYTKATVVRVLRAHKVKS